MTQPTTTPTIPQTSIEIPLDALVAIVEAKNAELVELPVTGEVLPFPTVL
ncbi:hypothetical protein ABID82_000676 [Methylobacterium sp. PvP062]|jgi:hypothetical protein|uniref:Uncharacterized protein n=1 Tax=Methylobacterium radiotolerans TaxID=31998 RepID=A0ABV2NHX2_9HYPH|nr:MULTISPECIES: hypothetical protein [Methylobacterium]MCX7333984.1 hypothetical protein [Hyphomicrobiales bacterium]GAN51672.1 hypothetical protein ME121_5759 [Methylobacterium sp. ME121]KZB97325.1 hypothetical protein AU375_06519 [Methylobacterium radiotolerans]MBN6820066.1 hypothetical protein [Methylobacterium organophilum]MBP2497159.1 hypothetical protein [Methylobacterium sp. PvP105]